MSPIAMRFVDVGAPLTWRGNWFTALLRDGLALTAAGGTAPFAQLSIGLLRASLDGRPLTRSIDDAIEHIVGGFDERRVHQDVHYGVPALDFLDTRLVTFSHGQPSSP